MKKINKERKMFEIFNIVFMVIMMVIMIYPLVYVFSASISNPGLVASGEVLLLPKKITIAAYREVVNDPSLWKAYYNTVKYVFLQVIFTLIITAMLAYPLSRKRLIGRNIILFLLAFTMIFQGGIIPKFLIVNKTGIYNTTWAMVVPMLITTYYLFIMRTFFESIPESLEESAIIDGCSQFRILQTIFMPLSKPVIMTIGLFTAVNRWNDYFNALVFLNDKKLYPLQIYLRNIVLANSMAAQTESLVGTEIQVVETVKYAVIIFATLPILFVYPFVQRYFVKGMMIGGVKG